MHSFLLSHSSQKQALAPHPILYITPMSQGMHIRTRLPAEAGSQYKATYHKVHERRCAVSGHMAGDQEQMNPKETPIILTTFEACPSLNSSVTRWNRGHDSLLTDLQFYAHLYPSAWNRAWFFRPPYFNEMSLLASMIQHPMTYATTPSVTYFNWQHVIKYYQSRTSGRSYKLSWLKIQPSTTLV